MLLVTASLQSSILKAVRLLLKLGTQMTSIVFFHQRHLFHFISKHGRLDKKIYGNFDPKKLESFWNKTHKDLMDDPEVFRWSNFACPTGKSPVTRLLPKTPTETFLYCLPDYIDSVIARLQEEEKTTFNCDITELFQIFMVSEEQINPFTTMDAKKEQVRYLLR